MSEGDRFLGMTLAELLQRYPQPASGDFSIGGKVWPGLSKLIEECGEVMQVAGKLIGSRGVAAHWDGSDLRDRLTEELGDLRGAIAFVVAECGLDPNAVRSRAERKYDLFQEWHDEPCNAPAQGIEAQRAETVEQGSVHESPVGDSRCARKDEQ